MSDQQQNSKQVTPGILGLADSPYYLVGAINQEQDFIPLSKTESLPRFKSLAMAKDYLRSHNYHSASLIFQSAYDEMCGTISTELTGQTIDL